MHDPTEFIDESQQNFLRQAKLSSLGLITKKISKKKNGEPLFPSFFSMVTHNSSEFVSTI